MSRDIASWLKLTSRAFALLSIVVVSASAAAASAQGRIAIPATAQLAAEVSATSPQRQVLEGDVVHYTWDVRLGPGQHDVIRLHRVVREDRPDEPAKLAQAVMFFPGLPTYFTGLYLTPLISDVPARDRAIAIYLAKNGVDVWGMDYRWAMAPEDTTDFGFMRKWGVQRDVADAQIALTLARWIRGEWSRLEGPLFLTGLSYGALMSYAVAANDTQRPAKFRNVKGIIPVDDGIEYGFGYVVIVDALEKAKRRKWIGDDVLELMVNRAGNRPDDTAIAAGDKRLQLAMLQHRIARRIEPGDAILKYRRHPDGIAPVNLPRERHHLAEFWKGIDRLDGEIRCLSAQGGLAPTGSGSSGEVEDYRIAIGTPEDFGDAPLPYPTLLANNGARHALTSGLFLGARVDAETNGQPTTAADGDDTAPHSAPDDEDGVNFRTNPLIPTLSAVRWK